MCPGGFCGRHVSGPLWLIGCWGHFFWQKMTVHLVGVLCCHYMHASHECSWLVQPVMSWLWWCLILCNCLMQSMQVPSTPVLGFNDFGYMDHQYTYIMRPFLLLIIHLTWPSQCSGHYSHFYSPTQQSPHLSLPPVSPSGRGGKFNLIFSGHLKSRRNRLEPKKL